MSYKYLLPLDHWFAQHMRKEFQENPDLYKISKEDIIREEVDCLDENGKDTTNYQYGRGHEKQGEDNPNWKGGVFERPCGWGPPTGGVRVWPEFAGSNHVGIPRPDMEGNNGINAKIHICPNCDKGPMAKGPYGTHKRLSASCSDYFSQLA